MTRRGVFQGALQFVWTRFDRGYKGLYSLAVTKAIVPVAILKEGLAAVCNSDSNGAASGEAGTGHAGIAVVGNRNGGSWLR